MEMKRLIATLTILLAISPAAFAQSFSTSFSITITIPEKPIEYRNTQPAQTITAVRDGKAVSLDTFTVK